MARQRIHLILAVVFCAAGVGLRMAVRPSPEDLAEQAGIAWNDGDVGRAEDLARSALGRSPGIKLARDVLIQVAAHDGRPLLEVAVLLDTNVEFGSAAHSQFRAGEVAYAHNYAAVAERAWRQAIAADPRNGPAYDRLIGLASVRLHHEQLMRWVRTKAKNVGVDNQTIRVMVGSEALISDAASLKKTVERYVKTDVSDESSRIGLSRCLLAIGAIPEAKTLLTPYYDSAAMRTMLALVECRSNNSEAAEKLLPDQPVADYAAEFWHAKGLIALALDVPGNSVPAFQKAVELRPLSREIRSDYCRALRLTDDEAENRRQSLALDGLQQIEAMATNPFSNWDSPFVSRLSELCEQVGADSHVLLLRDYLKRMEAER
ncbi:MAG: hypothetical protein ABGZ23_23585 [Fuerstiella sp.]